MAEVRKKVDVPIAADESCFTAQDALELIKRHAADIFAVRIEEAGGMLNCKKLVGIAEAAGVECVMGVWGETGIATLAKLHFVVASNNFPYANDTQYPTTADDILVGGKFPFSNGTMSVPERPGLGVEIDRQKLNQYTVR
jgi:L-alanine-DL-glutamate epimerase-like enolase superfamily enzyme